MPAPAPADAAQRLHGRFFTTGNPFGYGAFTRWWADIPTAQRELVLEPFAGAGAIARLMAEAGHTTTWVQYDIEPGAPDVERRDTLADFPTGLATVVTNPPYLSRHFARRKGLAVDHLPWGPHNSLYKVALDRCLDNASWVAAIVPESFVTSGLFRARLRGVVALTTTMFDDTEMPTCLALWGPDRQDTFDVWRGDQLLGSHADLAAHFPQEGPQARRVRFNDVEGPIGLRAIDSTTQASIAFVPAAEIPAEKIKHSARLVSRITVEDLAAQLVPDVIACANGLLSSYRAATADVGLTAFKGLRSDGQFRRRLDFATARALLGEAVAQVEAATDPRRCVGDADVRAA